MAEGLIMRFGEVKNVEDPFGGGRIQVRTPYDGPLGETEKLAYCIPLLPKMLHIVPKVGELVLVISMGPGEHEGPNYFIGPLISQEDKFPYEEKDGALTQVQMGYRGWGVNPHIKKGVLPTLYPQTEDIALEGRKDTGIQLKNEEVRVKAGVKTFTYDGPKNNTLNPAFISLKYYPKNDYKKDGFKSTATIVADKINLLGVQKDAATEEIPITENKDTEAEEQDNLISDSAMKEILNKAHQLPFGDQLVEFLDLLRTAFAKHVHPFPTMAPCNDENMKSVADYNLNGMLSDNVRIN